MSNTRSRTSKGASARWWLGLAAGASVSSTVTVIIVVWEWVENPGGIFRSEAGTNWGFILDTAFSWFVPTFVYVAVIVSVSHLAWRVVRNYLRKEE